LFFPTFKVSRVVHSFPPFLVHSYTLFSSIPTLFHRPFLSPYSRGLLLFSSSIVILFSLHYHILYTRQVLKYFHSESLISLYDVPHGREALPTISSRVANSDDFCPDPDPDRTFQIGWVRIRNLVHKNFVYTFSNMKCFAKKLHLFFICEIKVNRNVFFNYS
jgi:hypothetical protein